MIVSAITLANEYYSYQNIPPFSYIHDYQHEYDSFIEERLYRKKEININTRNYYSYVNRV